MAKGRFSNPINMLSRFKISQKGILLVCVPIAFEMLFIGALIILLRNAEYENWREAHYKAVIAEANRLDMLVYQSVALLASYGVTNSQSSLTEFDTTLNGIVDSNRSLKTLVLQESKDGQELAALEYSSNKLLSLLRRAKQLLCSFDPSTSNISRMQLLVDLKRNLNELLEASQKLMSQQTEKGMERAIQQERARQCVLIGIAIGIIGNIAITIILAMFFMREITSRLKVIEENTVLYRNQKPLKSPLSGEDELATLDKTFRQMVGDLDAAAQRKSEILSMVSHDLRTPVASLGFMLGLMSEGGAGELPPLAREKVKRGYEIARMMIKLINDLLDFEKMTSGKIDLEPKEIPISAVAERAIAATMPIAEAAGVVINSTCSNLTVWADESRITQVIVNLLTNAIKYSPGGAAVTLTVEQQGAEALIKVKDAGKGIPLAYQEKIFERYKQVPDSTERKNKGSGLGLMICKQFVELHGGRIGVQSNAGQGSTFWFTLPLVSTSNLSAVT